MNKTKIILGLPFLLTGCGTIFGLVGADFDDPRPNIKYTVSCDPSPKGWYSYSRKDAIYQHNRLEKLGRECVIRNAVTGEVIETEQEDEKERENI